MRVKCQKDLDFQLKSIILKMLAKTLVEIAAGVTQLSINNYTSLITRLLVISAFFIKK